MAQLAGVDMVDIMIQSPVKEQKISGSILDQPLPISDSWPVWFKEKKEQAWAEFQSLPFPKNKDEQWRFANLKKADFTNFKHALESEEKKNPSFSVDSIGLKENLGKIIYRNTTLIEEIRKEQLPDPRIILSPLRQGVTEHAELFQDYFNGNGSPLGSQKFAALHWASTQSGVLVYVPKNVQLELPLEVFHWIEGEEKALFPYTLIIAEENAKITVVDHFRSLDSGANFLCSTSELVVGEGAQVTYAACQNLNESSKSLQMNSTTVARNGEAKTFLLNLGSAWGRTESISYLNGEGANSDMLSVSIPSESQEFDQRTLQKHQQKHTTSDLLYKNILYDAAKTIFAGLIMVEEGAHHTDAYQTCRNLLMSNNVEANSMPGLEINADQVKCSHGSTSSRIRDEEIFYFNTRGIDKEVAKKLISFGFAQEVISRLKNESLEEMICAMVEKKFCQLGGG